MTEAAKRENSTASDASEEIAADDPLFELSQIMGLDEDNAAEPAANIDPQIDLEEALLAEMAVEPESTVESEVEAPSMATDDPAPTAESLEDELATMLGGAVSVAAEVPAPDVEAEIMPQGDPLPEAAAEPEHFDNADEELEATQLSEAVADAEIELDELSAEPEAASPTHVEEAPAAAEFETPFDGALAGHGQAEEATDNVAELLTEPADDSMLSLEEAEMELEKDFAAFFDEELPEADLSPAFAAEPASAPEAVSSDHDDMADPMEALASIGVEDAPTSEDQIESQIETIAEDSVPELPEEPEDAAALESEFSAEEEILSADETAVHDEEVVDQEPSQEPEMATVADVEAVSADVEQLNAGLEKIFGEQIAAGAAPIEFAESEATESETPAAPVLETTDMSAYEAANAVEVDVPDLPDLENEFVAAFENDAQAAEDETATSNDIAAAMGATVAAAGATVLSRTAGETAMAADEEAFDETRFEAELARDMEFVSHDLGNGDEADAALDDTFEDQSFAAQAAANKPAKRGLVIAAVLGCVAIAGAVGIFAYSNSEVAGTDGPILVEASPEPVKIEPENPGGVQVPNQDRAVFAENSVAPEQEVLVPGAEEPVDIAAVPNSALPSSLNGGETAQKGDDRLVPEATQATPTNDEIGALIAPRKVRTLVVKPDGTLVEREVVPTPEPIASAPEPEPAPAPEAPEVVAAIPEAPAPATVETPAVASEVQADTEVVPTQEATIEAPSSEAPVAEASSSNTNEASAVAGVTPEVVTPEATPAAETDAVDVAAAPSEPVEAPSTNVGRTISNPPRIADRPNDQPLNIVNPEPQANTQVASAPAVEQVAAASPTAAPFSVQLASLPSQESAQNTANNLSRQYSSLIGNRALSIREAQIEGRGTFYRVRVGASSRADANQLCGQVKAAGGDCFVTR